MRILELNTEKTWRGGERQTFYNIKGFKQADVEVELVCRKGYPLEEKTRTLQVPIHSISNHLSALLFLILKGSRFDIIHVQTAKSLLYALLSKPFHRGKVVYTRRVDFIPKGFFTKLKYRMADKIVAISTPIKNILQVTGAKNIPVITEIVEEKKLDTERAKQFLLQRGWENKKIIATTAAMVQHKDPLTMVHAIAELTKLRTDFVFLHFGSGLLQTEIEKLISELTISSYYQLPGFVANAEDFFSVFDVYTMSSEEEGLGSSVLDAFIYKVPVASTDAGGLGEILKDRGLLCEIKNHKSLAANIHRLLNDVSLKKELTEKAYSYAQSYNSLESVTKDYLKLFEGLVNKTKK